MLETLERLHDALTEIKRTLEPGESWASPASSTED
jgi:hypothetical protein